MRILLTALLILLAAACGRRGPSTPAKPLGPEHYVIAADDVPAAGEHMRYAAPKVGQAGGLDIAITEFRHPDGGPVVALVGVVHVADALYFDALQRELDAYDIVLYEGVKPEGLTKEAWIKASNGEGGEGANLQKDLAGWFGFEYQLEALDYSRKNFVHADMSMEEFLAGGGADMIPGLKAKSPPTSHTDGKDGTSTAATEEPGDSSATRAESIETPAHKPGVTRDILSTWETVKGFGDAVLGRPGLFRSMARKKFAETMGTADIGGALAMRPDFSELILIRRNKIVIDRLKEELPNAQASIAIFYGAAHMDDLQERLVEELGYERSGARWLRAWAIRPPLR